MRTLLKYIPDNSMSNLTSFKDLEVFEPEPQVLKRQVYIIQTLNHVSFIEQEEKVERVSLFSSFLKAWKKINISFNVQEAVFVLNRM